MLKERKQQIMQNQISWEVAYAYNASRVGVWGFMGIRKFIAG